MTTAPIDFPPAAPPPAAPPPSPAVVLRTPFPFSSAAQAVAIWAIVGSSIALAFAVGGLDAVNLASFLESNVLPDAPRWAVFVRLLLGGVLGGGFALLWLLVGRRRGVDALRRGADIVLPLAVAGLLPALFSAKPWHDKPTTFLVGMAATVLITEQLLRVAQRAVPQAFSDMLLEKLDFGPRVARWAPFAVVVAGWLFYAVYFSYYTILNHQRLNTSGFDLGINVNWCYNALNGHPERSSVLFGPVGGHFLGNHAIFAMFFWLPLYALAPGAEVLLIFQATMAGLGAVTLYLFATTQTTRWSAVVIAYAYLFFAPLHGPNFYDYHELLPPLPIFFLLFWAIAKSKNWLVVLLVPVLWSFREDVAVGITVLGLFLLLTGLRPRMGLLMAVISGIWFVLLKFFVMPMFWQTWFASIYKDLQAPGKSGYGTVVQTILINPAYFLTTLLREEKLIYFLHMLGPLALLPARRWVLLFLAVPGFAFSLLTTGYPPTLSISFQYTCHSIPYIFAASVLMLRLIARQPEGALKRRAVLGAIALGVLAHSYVFGAILQHETFVGGFTKVEFRMTPEEQARYRTMKKMAASIPQNASVAATETEVPHVAARMDAYTLKDGGIDGKVDYVLLNLAQMASGNTRNGVNQMFARHTYGLVMEGQGLYLFKRGVESDETRRALKALGLRPPKK
jgi:uncharacterized membrane protein